MSLVMFTGGSQFAFVSILGTGGLGAAPAAIATASMLGIRNGLYGLQTSQLLRVTGARRLAAAQLTIDESTAVGIAQPEPPAQRLGFWQTGIAVFVLWNLSTLLGAFLGNALGDPRRSVRQFGPAQRAVVLDQRGLVGPTGSMDADDVRQTVDVPHADRT